ncbi:MAG TPA: bifunctional nuclease domain-containing protein [Roseiflexaceae bacterium]
MSWCDDSSDDTALVARTLAGEREAFSPLLLRYYPSAMRLCRRLLGPTPAAQDAAQEAALQAFLNLSRLQEPARFGAWLHAIAANLARMLLRRRRVLSLEALPDSAPLAVLWSAGAHTPEEVHAARETHDAIVAALNELSIVNREVVIGFYLEGYTYADLAELLGVPVSTVKGRLFKGRRQLQRALESVAHEVLKPDRRRRKERIMEAPELVEVKVDSVRVSLLTQHRVIMLREEGAERILPIFIGLFEGDAIAMALEGRQPARPMTHDLTLRLVETLGAQVQRVVVNKIAEKTFYAEITLAQGEQEYQIDARPSDAIAMAVRIGAPIYVARTVIDQEGALLERTSDDSPGHFARVYGSSNFLEPPQRPFFYRTWSYLLALLTGDRGLEPLGQLEESAWDDRFPTKEVVWEGRTMLAVRLPYNDQVAPAAVGTAEDQAPADLAAAAEQAAFLLVPPAFWEEMSTIAQELIEHHRRGVSKYSSRGGTAPAAEQSEQQE